jgi:hypothetical protein
MTICRSFSYINPEICGAHCVYDKSMKAKRSASGEDFLDPEPLFETAI